MEGMDPKMKLCLSEQSIDIDQASSAQKINVSDDFLRVRVPARIHVSGQTQSGKSTMIYHIVKHREIMFMAKFKRVILCIPGSTMHMHTEYVRKMTDVCPHLEVVEGLPDAEKLGLLHDYDDHKLLILDDMIMGLVSSQSVLHLFLEGSHHSKISIIFSSQNYFIRGKHGSTIFRNCSELILFHNKADQMVIQNIGRQIFSGSPGLLQSAFRFIAKKMAMNPLKYVWIDMNLSSHLPEALKVRTNVLPDENGKVQPIFFVEKHQEHK